MRKKRDIQQSFFDPNFEALFPDASFTTDEELTGMSRLLDQIPESVDHIESARRQRRQRKTDQNGKTVRIDCSVVETNIAYPVDARLLVDSVRLLTRIMLFCRNDLDVTDFYFANRNLRAKKRACQIVMLKGPKAPRQRRKLYRDLLKVTEEVITMADEARYG